MPTTQSIRFGHFGINCFDIARMEDFYTRVMGMVVADRGYVPPPADRHLVFMTLDPGEHHQFILCSGRTEGQIEKGPFRGGGRGSAINQISFHMASLAELRRARDRLAAAGCNDGTPICHGNAWSIYIRDIEGNPMELWATTNSIAKRKRYAAAAPALSWRIAGARGWRRRSRPRSRKPPWVRRLKRFIKPAPRLAPVRPRRFVRLHGACRNML